MGPAGEAGAVVDAALRVADRTAPEPVDLGRVRVVGRLGGTIEDTALVASGDGIVLRQPRVANGTPSRVEKPRVALIQFCLSAPKTDMEGSVVVGDYAQMDRVLGLANVKAFHLNDSTGTLGSRVDRHARIGQGELGTGPFRLLVNDPRFAAHPGILEVPGETEAYAEDLALLRSLHL